MGCYISFDADVTIGERLTPSLPHRHPSVVGLNGGPQSAERHPLIPERRCGTAVSIVIPVELPERFHLRFVAGNLKVRKIFGDFGISRRPNSWPEAAESQHAACANKPGGKVE